jgi:sporulation protein YlmC with PRC-barrel domain
MRQPLLAASALACLCACFAGPLTAADLPTGAKGDRTSADTSPSPTRSAAGKCFGELRAFDKQMQKEGYWLNATGYGYGYPMYGYTYGEGGTLPPNGSPAETGYSRARPGYEVRTLVAAANILAQRGQQQACEELLTSTRSIYQGYAAELRSGGVVKADGPEWRRQQISAAVPVTAAGASFRSSDQLVGTDVVNPQSEDLGSVNDVVLSPKTGEIAYIVVSRGGLFGIDEKYVPVPWSDFKSTTGTSLLVLDSTKRAMDAAPRVKGDQFAEHGDFGREVQRVDDYWKANLSN